MYASRDDSKSTCVAHVHASVSYTHLDVYKRQGTPCLSCAPVGIYDLVLHNSVKHPRTFVLVNQALGIYASPTPGMRSDVLIHGGNVETDTEGCIILGCSRGTLAGEEAVLESAKALAQFRDMVPWIAGHTLQTVSYTHLSTAREIGRAHV